MSTWIAPCPFCQVPGERVAIYAAVYADGKCYRVRCGYCGAQGPLSIQVEVDPEIAMEDAITRWNAGRMVTDAISDAVRKDREYHQTHAFRVGPVPPRSFYGPLSFRIGPP
jgi:hypothetical protein